MIPQEMYVCVIFVKENHFPCFALVVYNLGIAFPIHKFSLDVY